MLAETKKASQGASSEVVRDINRRLVLHLIRKRNPISRADLARISGLQRSTISIIVEQLIEERWVLEGPTGRLPRGRRPTYLRLDDERVIIGADVRPIHTTVALSDASGRFLSQEIMNTPADPEAATSALIQSIQRMVTASRGRKIEGVGITLPGRFDHSRDRLVFAPNLNWRDLDIRNPIAKATGLEVELENAANACVLSAVWFDLSGGARNFVLITVSEGIGTGILANGQLVRGSSGMAGEFGHAPLEPNGPQCGCGGCGCWEVFASNRAALRYYAEARGSEPDIAFTELLSRADRGDGDAAKALSTMAHYLGKGMRMVVAGLAPERIILIGDLTRSWDRFGPALEAEVRAQTLPGAIAPTIVPVHEDGMARLRGTIALILQKHFGIGVEVTG